MADNLEGIGFLLGDITRLVRNEFKREIENGSLTLAKARLLKQISRKEGVRQVELADDLDIQPITLARLIDHLQGAGVVERRLDPADRRAYKIYLTPAAKPLLLEIDRAVKNILGNVFYNFSESEKKDFFQLLCKFHQNIARQPVPLQT